MCNTPKKHQHYDAIVAWAAGKPIQFRDSTGVWLSVTTPTWQPGYEYRVKPAGAKYRLYLFQRQHDMWVTKAGHMVYTCCRPEDEKFVETLNGFVRWLGDWKEVEV